MSEFKAELRELRQAAEFLAARDEGQKAAHLIYSFVSSGNPRLERVEELVEQLSLALRANNALRHSELGKVVNKMIHAPLRTMEARLRLEAGGHLSGEEQFSELAIIAAKAPFSSIPEHVFNTDTDSDVRSLAESMRVWQVGRMGTFPIDDYVAEEDARRILEEVKESNWKYRTVAGIASQLSLSEERVEDVLSSFPQYIRESPLKKEKERLFVSRERDLSFRERLELILSYLAKRRG